MSKQEVVVAKGNGAGLPATMMQEMLADAGKGMENLTTQDYAIPFVSILQALSPQLNKTKGAYIKGAEQGNILNTLTKEVAQEIRVVPVAYRFQTVEWKPRDSGGGFVAAYERGEEPTDTTKDEKGHMVRKNGNMLTPTAYHYVLVVKQDGTWEQAVVSMSATQLKKSRKWNSLAGQLKIHGPNGPVTPPLFSHVYKLSTVAESNNSGSWYGWEIGVEGPISDANLYRAAKSFAEAVHSGLAKAAAPESESSASKDDDIPF